MTAYTSKGERSTPYKTIEEIYSYNWKNDKIKRINNGNDVTNQSKFCKICYNELIEEIKSEFKKK